MPKVTPIDDSSRFRAGDRVCYHETHYSAALHNRITQPLAFMRSLLARFIPETPLAWSQLSHQKVRLTVALGGIAFANVLIFMQLGFKTLFEGGATILPESLHGDLFLLNPTTEFIGANGFDRIRLAQAAAVKGVKAAVPLYIGAGSWGYSKEFTSFEGRFYGFNPQTTVFKIPEVQQQQAILNSPRTLMIDRLTKPSFGPVLQDLDTKGVSSTLVNNKRAEVQGAFRMGNSFFIGAGNILMSEESYAYYFGDQSLQTVSVGIITVEPGADLAAIKAGIAAVVPGVKVYTSQELVAKELAFQETTAVGPIFGFGAMMGIIVGVVIVYQVLYADVSDHLAEYATLKAMGYSDMNLLGVIFQESVILAVLGFAPGFGASIWMYKVLGGLTRLDLIMTPELAITVFLLTLAMCLVSAVIASGKLRSADPADVF
jgi:putative ABC transport system permease protein